MRPQAIHTREVPKIGSDLDTSFMDKLRQSLFTNYHAPKVGSGQSGLASAFRNRMSGGGRQGATRQSGGGGYPSLGGGGGGPQGSEGSGQPGWFPFASAQVNQQQFAEQNAAKEAQAAPVGRAAPTEADYQHALATASPVQGQPNLTVKQQEKQQDDAAKQQMATAKQKESDTRYQQSESDKQQKSFEQWYDKEYPASDSTPGHPRKQVGDALQEYRGQQQQIQSAMNTPPNMLQQMAQQQQTNTDAAAGKQDLFNLLRMTPEREAAAAKQLQQQASPNQDQVSPNPQQQPSIPAPPQAGAKLTPDVIDQISKVAKTRQEAEQMAKNAGWSF